MAKKNRGKRNRRDHGFKHPEELVSQRVRFASSGAAGVHADQKNSKTYGVPHTNRVGSRGSARRAAI